MSQNPPINTTWSRQLAKGLIDPNKLETLSNLSQPELKAIKENFDVRVPLEWVEMLSREEIRKQVVPDKQELTKHRYELKDPIGDELFSPIPGLTHRYQDRVLLKPTYLCGVYCRFCFRRYIVSKSSENLTKDQLSEAIEYIKTHEEIHEVILTGGDPLTLTNQRLETLLKTLDAIPHVRRLRIHSRIPVVLPERVDQGLLSIFSSLKKPLWLSIHANHPVEFSEHVASILKPLHLSGVHLILQSVLLKDVNDSLETLKELFERSLDLGIKPYYLHYPDQAEGTDHFRIPLDEAIELFSQLRGQVSGHALPHFVLDLPHGYGKIPLDKSYLSKEGDHQYRALSPVTKEFVTVKY